MHLNIWLDLLGTSSISRKSVSTNIMNIVIDNANLNGLLGAQSFTPEGLIDDLNENKRSGIVIDEVGAFYADFSKKYNSNMVSLLCKLFDCPKTHSRKLSKRKIELTDIYFSMLGNTTPEQIARYLSVDDINNGFVPRHLYIYPTRIKKTKPRKETPEDNDKKKQMLGMWLSEIYKALSDAKEVKLKLETDALELYNDWFEALEMQIQEFDDVETWSRVMGRYADYVLKIAALIEMGKTDTLGHITDKYNEFNKYNKYKEFNKYNCTNFLYILNLLYLFKKKSQAHSNKYKVSSTRVFEIPVCKQSVLISIKLVQDFFLPTAIKINEQIFQSEGVEEIRRVFNLGKHHKDKESRIKRSRWLTLTQLKARDFDEIITTLEQCNRIEKESMALKGSKKPTVIYKIIDDDEVTTKELINVEEIDRKTEKKLTIDLEKEGMELLNSNLSPCFSIGFY